MLKEMIPLDVPSVWVRIKELRINDDCALAPKMKQRVLEMRDDFHNTTFIDFKRDSKLAQIPFDPILFETERKDELQKIYYNETHTTNAPSAIYGWHFYRLATDWISASREWSVPVEWWQTLARYMRKHKIDPGFDWLKPDKPHGQFGGMKKSPSDVTRIAYFGVPAWNSLSLLTGAAHEEGLLRVWRLVGAV